MNKTKALALLILITISTATMYSMVIAQTTPNTNIQNTWTTRAAMPTARWGLGVAVVGGKIYAIGGSGSIGSLNTTEAYDPKTDTWTTKASMPTPRTFFPIAAYQGKIYCIGGQGSQGFLSTNEAYDPQTNTWTTKTSMPTPAWYCGANVVNGKIYVMTTDLAQIYDPQTDTWTTKTKPTTATYTSSAAIDDKIYIIDQQRLDIYDTRTDTWSTGATPIDKGSYPTLSSDAAAATTGLMAPKEIAVIGGGYAPPYGILMTLDTVEVYFPANDSWIMGQPMPTARRWLGVAALNDTFYAIGGEGGPFNPLQILNTNEQYIPPGYGSPEPSATPQSPSPTPTQSTPTPSPSLPNTWITRTSMITARYGLGVEAVDGKIYAIGGIKAGNTANDVNTTEAYDPETDTWTTKTPMPNPNCFFATTVLAKQNLLHRRRAYWERN